MALINVMMDDVVSGLNDLIEGSSSLPTPGEVSSQGTGVGVTSPFRAEVSATATSVKAALRAVASQLRASDEDIRATVAALLEKDETLADEANQLLTFLDSIPDVVVTPADRALGANNPKTGQVIA